MDKKLISIANDFSRFPAGRYYADGPYTGQKFREEFLVPAFKNADHVIVNIDDTLGYGSSFLEEAFGGLIREHNMSYEDIKAKLEIIGTVETYKNRIWTYLMNARPKK